jgi:predicted  nucleic acid-binding Zn-ribbon protein
MSLTRTLNDLEGHMDSARDSFYHLQEQVDEIITECVKEVAELKNLVESLEEQNTLLEEDLEAWKVKCATLEAENLEVTAKYAHYTLSS